MAPDPSALISQYNSLAEKSKLLKTEGNYKKRIEADQDRLEIAKQTGNQELVFDSFWSLVESYIYSGDPDSGYECADEALYLAKKWNNHKEEQSLLIFLTGKHFASEDYGNGNICWDQFNQNEMEYGSEDGLKAAILRIKQRTDIYIYDTFDPILQTLSRMGKYEEGIKVVKVLQSISIEDDDVDNYIGGLEIEFELADNAGDPVQLNEVVQKIENVLNLQLPSDIYVGTVYSKLGLYKRQQGKLAEELDLFKKWEIISQQQAEGFENLALIYFNQGLILIEQKEPGLAKNALNKGLEIAKRYQQEEQIIQIRELLAEINKEPGGNYQQMKNKEYNLDEGEIELTDEQRNTLIRQAMLLQKQGNGLLASDEFFLARKALNKAEKLAKESGDEVFRKQIKADLKELDRKLEESNEASSAKINADFGVNNVIEGEVEEEKDHSFKNIAIGIGAAIVLLVIVILIFVNAENFTVKICSGGLLLLVGYGIYKGLLKSN